jgi:hypothetical protein
MLRHQSELDEAFRPLALLVERVIIDAASDDGKMPLPLKNTIRAMNGKAR